jgi:hypothetical protein
VDGLIPIEVFATGTYQTLAGTDVTFTTADLDEIVANFAALREHIKPPLKFGHGPQAMAQPAGQMALGWVAALERQGDKLLAHVAEMPPIVRKAIKAGRWKRVSAELLLAFEKTPWAKNITGVSGKVLEAVSLLGADPPQVTNLADLQTYLAAFEGEPIDDELRLAASAPTIRASDVAITPSEALTTALDAAIEAALPRLVDEIRRALPSSDARSRASSASTPGHNPVRTPMPDDDKSPTVETLQASLKTQQAQIDQLLAAHKATDDERTKLAATVASQAATITELTAKATTAAEQLQAAQHREMRVEAEAFALRYSNDQNLRVLPAQRALLSGLYMALSDTPVLAAVEAAHLSIPVPDGVTALTGRQLLTQFLEAGQSLHKLLGSTLTSATGATDYDTAMAKIAGREKLNLGVPADRAKVAGMLAAEYPDIAKQAARPARAEG